MDIRIMCDAFVKIDNVYALNNVGIKILDYKLMEKNLEGFVLIHGDYTKDITGEQYKFSEEVPFTLVFKNSDYIINDIKVEDFKYYEVVNQGIKCDFSILVVYEIKINEKAINNAIFEKSVNDNLIDEIENNGIEETSEEIKEKYDALLSDIFQVNNRKEKEEDESIKVKTKVSDAVDFSKFQESKGKYRVYYPKEEKDIEGLCNLEKTSINNIYLNDCNKDFAKKKRIIIKK